MNRSSYPTRLTPAGKTLYDQALEMCRHCKTRAPCCGTHQRRQDMIEFAVPHTLAFTFFPAWVSSLHEKIRPFKKAA